ncbi:MAG TPA: TPM domain-containing protein [Tepidisphaeraceae bacterium]|jgi:uncharacterized membrane protein|nr:TPM domain-containing protein [Tepidisphaeraceae bacterium]
MKTKAFLNGVSDQVVLDAITQASRKTSGEIRVFVSHHKVKDAVTAAHREFARMGLHEADDRNAVLIYVSPKSRKFAVIGDHGVHQHCNDGFWTTLAGEMEQYFRKGEWTEGLVHGVAKAGELLGEKFPKT